MTKQRKRKSKPATLRMDADWLAEQMAATATMMWTVAERMEYFAGFNPRLRDHAFRLAAFGSILKTWCSEVREQANAHPHGRVPARTVQGVVGASDSSSGD
jgi:hypothetical protein